MRYLAKGFIREHAGMECLANCVLSNTKRIASFFILPLLVFISIWPTPGLSNTKILSIAGPVNPYASEPNITSKGRDSIVINGPKKPFDTFGAPKFKNVLSGEVNYGKEYSSVIKVETPNLPETQIKAISKPEWLKIKSQKQVSIIAGSDIVGFNNGIGNKARFYSPYALTSDSKGTIFVADQVDNRIRKISLSGEVSTLAGSAAPGFKDGEASEARFNTPSGIAVDAKGFIYISDQGNHSIRKISPSGRVLTLAGGQNPGYVDGEGTTAKFNMPAGICVDARGYLYVADRGNNRIRMISPDGKVSTLAGSGKAGFSEGIGTNAKFNAPAGITVDNAGFLYVADQVNNRIRKINIESGQVSTFAGNGDFGLRDGEARQASFKYPTGIVADSVGNLYIADQLNHSIRMIGKSGKVTSITDGDDKGVKAEGVLTFKNPMGICLDLEGNLLVADYHNHNVKAITFNTLLYGTPSKSQVGSYEIVLEATNEFGSTVQSGKLIVKDTIGPKVVTMLPANLAGGLPRKTDAVITFDEEIRLRGSRVIIIFAGSETIFKYNIEQGLAEKRIRIAEDLKSLIVELKDLPAASTIKISMEDGAITDKLSNPFLNAGSPLATWSFITKPKEKQSLDLQPISEKIYGDANFKLGPIYSSAGLRIEYIAEDPSILSITGDSARILRAGNTSIIALQKGDSDYVMEKVQRSIHISTRPILIKPEAGQFKTYGSVPSAVKFVISSGSIVNSDKFSGFLEKAKGDAAGVYDIVVGSLTLGKNYDLKITGETFLVKKAPLLIKAANHTKVAGLINPEFTCIYEGFVNGDDAEDLVKKPEFTCAAMDKSNVGIYPINLTGAIAKNYVISYNPGELKISPAGSAEFSVKYVNLFENAVAGTIAAELTGINQGSQAPIFALVQGEGAEDNGAFRLNGNSLVTIAGVDYESKEQYSVRIKSDGAYGETSVQNLTVSILDVNERPEMSKIPLDIICSSGTIQLTGINAGPEANQEVKIIVKDGNSGTFFEVALPVNGVSAFTYKLPDNYGNLLNIRIILKDNGGTANGGVDSSEYSYTLKVARQAPIRISSDKGTSLQRGISSTLSVNGEGQYKWYFNNQIIPGARDKVLNVNAEETGAYRVQVTSDGGCISEAKIDITVANILPVSCTNLISANFDGINDEFVVRNIEHYPGNELWISDRAGKLVFNQKNYSNSWKGTYHDNALPVGIYYYVLDLGNKTAKIKGYISVIN